MKRTLALTLLLLGSGPALARAQLPAIRGYNLTVPIWSDSTDFAVGGFGLIDRARLMSRPAVGDLALEAAYEHVLTYSQRAAPGAGSVVGVIVPGGGEWAKLQWTIAEEDRVAWGHRFDRLNLQWAPTELLQINAGRQTISWATTLILTPADPFIPFDPSDPFREYRAGVDALRVQAFPGQFTEFDFVVRPAKTRVGDHVVDETLTVLARARTLWQGWELSAWGGALHDEPAGAVSTSGGIGRVAVRGEASLRSVDDELFFRGTAGIDTRFDLLSRDLYLVFEYQHDEFGASGAEDLVTVISSGPFARGELQALSQDITVGQAAYQVHPLLTLDALVLWSLSDGSLLLAPGATYSASNEVTLRLGGFVGFGDDVSGTLDPIPSEYGIVPAIFYASVSAFF
ncbi:MAG: hypothetical protein JSU87_16305 [Gemmatimonadota bacterium]|nr:MAG: hypothetical protein JSU87_16305 [Gemmatimonadota bacterium]